MVQTRRQYNNWVATRGDNYQSSQSSQGSSQHSIGSFGGGNDYEPEGNPNYKENDHCKRHRKEDGSEKTKKVKAYKRRTPLH